jgi:hypothetical protein
MDLLLPRAADAAPQPPPRRLPDPPMPPPSPRSHCRALVVVAGGGRDLDWPPPLDRRRPQLRRRRPAGVAAAPRWCPWCRSRHRGRRPSPRLAGAGHARPVGPLWPGGRTGAQRPDAPQRQRGGSGLPLQRAHQLLWWPSPAAAALASHLQQTHRLQGRLPLSIEIFDLAI